MPRRNLIIILATAAIALVCYHAADHNPLGRVFSEIADQIERRYVDSVSRSDLWNAAVHGMIEKLSDPYSEYIDPQQAARLEELLDQQFGGIGVEVAPEPQNHRLTVISPIVGSPAYRAGIVAGDVIAKIDGASTQNMSFADAAQHLRGPPGGEVRLSIQHDDQQDPIDLPPIKREIVKVDSVLGDRRGDGDRWSFLLQHDPNIGYVRIVNFGERTADELKAALAQLRSEKAQGLILDLRSNPGGLVPAAIAICDMFLAKGQRIVAVQGRSGEMAQQYDATGGEKFPDIPMVVLVNGGSASASEIVAAALQDHRRATVIGERTWGKGTIQTVIPLRGGLGILKLTTAGYLRPNNHNIHRRPDAKEEDQWGVTPDDGYVVTMTADDWRRWTKWRADRDIVPRHDADPPASPPSDSDALENDLPLERAIQCIEATIASRSATRVSA